MDVHHIISNLVAVVFVIGLFFITRKEAKEAVVERGEYVKQESLSFHKWIDNEGYDYSDCSPDKMWEAYQESKLK